MSVGGRFGGGRASPHVPPDVAAAHVGWDREVASAWPPNSVMWRLSSPSGEVRFLKVVRHGWTPGTGAEAERLRWARPWVPVPEVLGEGSDDEVSWLLTGGLPGRDATDPGLRAQAERLVALLAGGLRDFHERLPARACPFPFGLDEALDLARRRLEAGLVVPARDFHDEHGHLTAEGALRQLEATRPSAEDPVVCHGDYCLPNVLLDGNRVVGYVDLGELGVADRWWDLAVASWSVTWNLGPGLEELFHAVYGVEPDPGRIRFYRLLYDVVS